MAEQGGHWSSGTFIPATASVSAPAASVNPVHTDHLSSIDLDAAPAGFKSPYQQVERLLKRKDLEPADIEKAIKLTNRAADAASSARRYDLVGPAESLKKQAIAMEGAARANSEKRQAVLMATLRQEVRAEQRKNPYRFGG